MPNKFLKPGWNECERSKLGQKISYFLFLLSSTTEVKDIFQSIYFNKKEIKLASTGAITYPCRLEFYIRALVISSVKIGISDQKIVDIIIIVTKQINNSWKTYT